MAALAVDTPRALQGSKTVSFTIKNATQIYVGSYVSLLGGYAQPFAGAAGELLVGRALPTPIQTLPSTSPFQLYGNTSALAGSQSPQVTVCMEPENLLGVSVTGASAITQVGSIVYLNSNDNDITLTRPTRGQVFGMISDWKTGTTCNVLRFGFEALATLAIGGNGVITMQTYMNLADVTTATDYTIGAPQAACKLRSVSATVLVAPTGSAGVTTFQPKIGSTAVTGGLVTVSTGDATAAIDAGTTVTALNTLSEGSALKLTVTKTGTVTTGTCLLVFIFDRVLGL